MLSRLMIALAFFWSSLALAQSNEAYVLKPDPQPWKTGVASFFGPILVHETGHALTGLLLGGSLESFMPFPHISGGKLVGGSVGLTGLSGWRSITTGIMGTGTNILFVLAAAPSLPHMKNVQNRYMLEGALSVAALDFFGYLVFDSLLAFNGDWQAIANAWKIPVWTLLPIAAGVSYGLVQYVERFSSMRPNKAVIEEPEVIRTNMQWSMKSLKLGSWIPFLEHDARQGSWALGLQR